MAFESARRTLDYQDIDSGRLRHRHRTKFIIVGVVVTLAAIAAIVTTLVLVHRNSANTGGGPDSLVGAMYIGNIMAHLQALQDIADKYNGTRSTNANLGYQASVDYVVSRLSKTNFVITKQAFKLPQFELGSPAANLSFAVPPLSLTYGKDYNFWLGWHGLLQLDGLAVSRVARLGCNATDWAGFVPNTAALVLRGVCPFADKVALAEQFNATALLLSNDGADPDRYVPPGPYETLSNIPVLGLSYALGWMLSLSGGGISCNLLANQTALDMLTTYNVIADTPTGNSGNVIVVGSHLDSVDAGPGINDNGSGSAVNLELALQTYALGLELKNKIRFCWFGGEELGLLGSTHYVENLVANDTAELARIAVNLNFDMLGSPNYFRGVYNGSSAKDPLVRGGSAVVQSLFEKHFQDYDKAYELTEFTGRSDYGPFIDNHIPAGGLFTGAEVVKSPDQRGVYGGIANAAFDPCYHQSCDTVSNVHTGVLEDNALAAADILQQLAQSSDLRGFLNGGSSSSYFR